MADLEGRELRVIEDRGFGEILCEDITDAGGSYPLTGKYVVIRCEIYTDVPGGPTAEMHAYELVEKKGKR